MKKRAKIGLDYLRDRQWVPVVITRRQAERKGEQMARRRFPKGFWNAVVVDCGEYWRINLAGQKENG